MIELVINIVIIIVINLKGLKFKFIGWFSNELVRINIGVINNVICKLELIVIFIDKFILFFMVIVIVVVCLVVLLIIGIIIILVNKVVNFNVEVVFFKELINNFDLNVIVKVVINNIKIYSNKLGLCLVFFFDLLLEFKFCDLFFIILILYK